MASCSISIVVPAFNSERHLSAALESIKAQHEPPDEVILVDDGSCDRTREIAQAFKFAFPYRVVSIENAGQGNARNLGARLASFEYVYFFDSDDLLKADFIRTIRQQLQEYNKPDIALFSGRSFNDPEYRGSRWINYRRGFEGYFAVRTDFMDKALEHNALFCSPCLYISRRSLWGYHGLMFGEHYLEDEAVFYPLLFSCHTFLVMDQVLFLRRNREGSTMTVAPTAKHVLGALDCIHAALSLLGHRDLSHRERWHIRRRIEARTLSYIRMARQAGVRISYGPVLRAFASVPSARFFAKALVRAARAEALAFLSTRSSLGSAG